MDAPSMVDRPFGAPLPLSVNVPSANRPAEVLVELPGEPRGWGRAGVRIIRTKEGRMFPSHYTDAKTRNEQAMLRYAAEKAMDGRPPFDCPLVVRITAVFLPPSSWSGKKRLAAVQGLMRHSGKPDRDNIEKLANDALNKIVWIDDARICDGITSKWYGEKPFLRIEVWRWSPLLV